MPRLSVTILPKTIDQNVQGAVENTGYLNIPTNKAPFPVDNIVVIDLTSDDNKDVGIVQEECKLEEGSANDMVDTSTSDVIQCNAVGVITIEGNPS